jgi:hypothetical protein
MTYNPNFNILDTVYGDRVLNAAAIAAILAGASAPIALTDDLSVTKELSSGTPATERLTYSKMSLSHQGNVVVGGGSGSLAGVRGEINIEAGVTAKDGFYYGAQGKAVLAGTMDQTSATRIAAILAQLDASAGTITAGQLSALWADMGSTAPASWGSETNVLRATNTTLQSVNAILYGYGKAAVAMDLSDNSSGWAIASGAATTAAGALKIKVNGNVRYINLYSTAPA